MKIRLTGFLQFRKRTEATLPLVVGILLALTFDTACGSGIRKQEDDLMQKQAALEAKLFEQAKVLYAKKNIYAGDTFTSEALEERSVQISRIPPDALPSVADALNHKVKYDIPAGQIISKFDLSN